MATILIADRESASLTPFYRSLNNQYNLLFAHDSHSILATLEAKIWRLNAVILDSDVPGINRNLFQMVEKLLQSNPCVPMLVLAPNSVGRAEFSNMGVFQVLRKPLNLEDLRLSLVSALNYNQIAREYLHGERSNRELSRVHSKLYGVDPVKIEEQIRRHDTPKALTPILIQAETGFRPATLARIISHQLDGQLFFHKICKSSSRNMFPFHIQGGDTLFLEGIECLNDKQINDLYNKIFSDSRNSEPFRLIASITETGQNGKHENVESNRFRSLFSKNIISVVPFRNRKHVLRDIILELFEIKKKQIVGTVETISDDMVDVLQQYNWPGNFDELDFVLQSLLMTCPDKILLPKHVHHIDFSNIFDSQCPTLAEMTDEHIRKAMRLTMGNKSRAARMLGITPKTLYARIRD